MKPNALYVLALISAFGIVPACVNALHLCDPNSILIPLFFLPLSFGGFLINAVIAALGRARLIPRLLSIFYLPYYIFIVPVFALPLTPLNFEYVATYMGAILDLLIVAIIPLYGFLCGYIFCGKTAIENVKKSLTIFVCAYAVFSFIFVLLFFFLKSLPLPRIYE